MEAAVRRRCRMCLKRGQCRTKRPAPDGQLPEGLAANTVCLSVCVRFCADWRLLTWLAAEWCQDTCQPGCFAFRHSRGHSSGAQAQVLVWTGVHAPCHSPVLTLPDALPCAFEAATEGFRCARTHPKAVVYPICGENSNDHRFPVGCIAGPVQGSATGLPEPSTSLPPPSLSGTPPWFPGLMAAWKSKL